MPLVSANIVSDWRQALVTDLRTAYPSAIVESKRRTGVNREPEPRISVHFDGYQEAQTVVVANPVMVVRYWPPRASEQPPEDAFELEQAAVDLLRLFQDRMVAIEDSIDDLWYFRVVSVVIDEDPDEWGVEARLLGYARNLAVPA